MESTVALISASISLSLFAKPQLFFTTRLWSGFVLTAGLVLEFCGLPLEKAVSITIQRNSAEVGREYINLRDNIFRSVVLRRWSIGNHWFEMISVRGNAEITLFTETRTFSGLVTRGGSQISSWFYYQPCLWANNGIWKRFILLGMFNSDHHYNNYFSIKSESIYISIPAKVIAVKFVSMIYSSVRTFSAFHCSLSALRIAILAR